MPNSDFDEGFNLFYDEFAPRLGDIGSISANQLDGTYLSSIKESVVIIFFETGIIPWFAWIVLGQIANYSFFEAII